jgi:hypothetical protein
MAPIDPVRFPLAARAEGLLAITGNSELTEILADDLASGCWSTADQDARDRIQMDEIRLASVTF